MKIIIIIEPSKERWAENKYGDTLWCGCFPEKTYLRSLILRTFAF
jgi:hypothetical protein